MIEQAKESISKQIKIPRSEPHGKVVGLIHHHNKIDVSFMQKMILYTLSMKFSGGEAGATEELLLSMNRITRPEESSLDVRRELDFLASLGLVNVRKERGGSLFATVTKQGMDVSNKLRDAFMRKAYQQ